MNAFNERSDAGHPDARDLVEATGRELAHTAAILRRAEEAILTALSDPERDAFQMADVQLLDLAIQTLDELAPFMAALSSGVSDTRTVDTSSLIEGLRLAGLRARLTRTGHAAPPEDGSIEMF
ncbi:hypothetical protein HKCCE3408_12015 [Rhodobacterales bacterium HKCCE3408]|nr:hypothetical protein [Rhodobacterales bacterium HKCCE3408]